MRLSSLPQVRDQQRLTPLHLACAYGRLNEARVLLENGARIESTGYRDLALAGSSAF